jgi:hypothetical protein
LGFENIAVSIDKRQFLNSVENEKKNNVGKKFFYEDRISIGRINIQKISLPLGRFYRKTAPKKHFTLLIFRNFRTLLGLLIRQNCILLVQISKSET